MTRPVHKAKHLRADGCVSALCSKTPRAIDLKRASWTIRNEAVTCPRCLALLASGDQPTSGSLHRFGAAVVSEKDIEEIDRAARFARLVNEAIACGVPRDEAVDSIFPDVYPEPARASAQEALRE